MRRKILDAAFEMFVEVGYERTSIRAIAEKIEYSPATIYLYYKDKDELLYEVQREAFDLLAKSFAPLAEIRHPSNDCAHSDLPTSTSHFPIRSTTTSCSSSPHP